MATNINITWEGLETWEMLTNPVEFQRQLQKEVARANKILGPLMVAKVRKDIKDKRYAKNAILTVLLKGSSTPLIDHGDLWGSISYQTRGPWRFEVGVVREDAAGNSIALILHEGATRKVTEKMRAFFRAKAAETKGLVRPLKTSTREIRIPPRPFLKESLVDDTVEVGQLLRKHWGEAVKRTIEALGRKGKK